MKWLLIYRLSSGQWPDLKAVHSTYHRLTDRLPTWVEQSKDTCSWSTSSFPTIIYSGSIISFLSCSIIFVFPLPTYIHLHLYGACWLSVCDWHSLNTNYYGTTFGGVPGSFNSDQIECMCSQNRPRFKVPSERLSNEVQVPCLRGLRNDQQKSCFLLSPTVPPQ